MESIRIKRAIISLSDKGGIELFAKPLSKMGVEILSTGGTAKILKESDIPVIEVADYTGFPEMMDGRVKTLHPMIHGGILFKRNNAKHVKECLKQGIKPIDMVVVNLYQFEKTIAKENVSFEEAIENIDIGGPTIIRAAAKNFQDVVVIIDPLDYTRVLDQLYRNGDVDLMTRLDLARKVFDITNEYDKAIAGYLKKCHDNRGA